MSLHLQRLGRRRRGGRLRPGAWLAEWRGLAPAGALASHRAPRSPRAAAVLATYRGVTGLDAGTALLVLMACAQAAGDPHARGTTSCSCSSAGSSAWRRSCTSRTCTAAVWVAAGRCGCSQRRCSTSRAAASPARRMRPFRTTGAMLLKALPLALVFFLFFPRVAGHFWGAPSSERASRPASPRRLSPGRPVGAHSQRHRGLPRAFRRRGAAAAAALLARPGADRVRRLHLDAPARAGLFPPRPSSSSASLSSTR
jgi:hypothetical protein